MPLERPTALEPIDAESGHFAIYSWANIMIICWSKRATGPAIARVTRARSMLDAKHPEGISVVYLIADNAGLPTPEAREGVRELMARFRDRRACLAVVIKGQGFWLSAMRAAITSVRMLVSSDSPVGIFSTVDELIEWLPPHHQQHTQTVLPVATLRGVLQQLMSSL